MHVLAVLLSATARQLEVNGALAALLPRHPSCGRFRSLNAAGRAAGPLPVGVPLPVAAGQSSRGLVAGTWRLGSPQRL